MPINESKVASNLLVTTEHISQSEIQNRFGAKHDVIRDISPGKYLTILAVETDTIVNGDGYAILENVLKNQFGVRAMQTVFDASIPETTEPGKKFNVYISGHLRIEEPLS